MKVVLVTGDRRVAWLGTCQQTNKTRWPGDTFPVASLRPFLEPLKMPINLDDYVTERATFLTGKLLPQRELVLVSKRGRLLDHLPEWKPLPSPVLLGVGASVSVQPPWWTPLLRMFGF